MSERVVITHIYSSVKSYVPVDAAAQIISTNWNERYKAMLERRQQQYPDRILKPKYLHTAEEIKKGLLGKTTYFVGEDAYRFAFALEIEASTTNESTD